MKKMFQGLYDGIYQWQTSTWGSTDVAGFTSLMFLSTLQSINILSFLIVIQNLTGTNILKFLIDNVYVLIAIIAVIVILDIRIVKTKKYKYKKPKTMAFLYAFLTILILVGCLTWIVIINESHPIR